MGILYPVGDGYGRNFVPEVGFGYGDGDGSMFMGTGLGSQSLTGNSPLTSLGAKLIGRAHRGFVSFWEGPWCLGALRNKHMLLYPPLRPSMLPQDSVAHNYFG